MIWTAWTNGQSGFGLKVPKNDIDCYFDKSWTEIILELPYKNFISCNINKKSFWNKTCRELISKKIKEWFIEKNIIGWTEKGNPPPKFEIKQMIDNHFKIIKIYEN